MESMLGEGGVPNEHAGCHELYWRIHFIDLVIQIYYGSTGCFMML